MSTKLKKNVGNIAANLQYIVFIGFDVYIFASDVAVSTL